MKLALLGASEIEQALPMPECIEAMRGAFRAVSDGSALQPLRTALRTEPGLCLVKPAALPGQALGAKIVSVFEGNRERGLPTTPGLVILADPETGMPAALLDGTFLTIWRTAAATALATQVLAPRGVLTGALIGAGALAPPHLQALDHVCEFEVMRIFARRREAAEELVDNVQSGLSCRLEIGDSADQVVDGADVVTTITSASEPLFDGRLLRPCCHINAVGSYRPDMREIDDACFQGAQIVVDALESAAEEAGELRSAQQAGLTRPESWVELGRLVDGDPARRPFGERRTIFKSMGLAAQDLAAGAAAWKTAKELGVREVEL